MLQIRGQALRGLGRWPEAIETLERGWGLARRTAFPSTVRARSANNLATTLIYAGQPDRAMPYLREALANWRELGGEDSSSALTIMANLAGLLHQRGELDAAESLYREAIDRRTRRFGASGALAAAHLNLGALLALTGPAEEALDHAETGLEMILRYEGTDSLGHARALLSRGRVLRDLGQRERASADLGAARDMFSDRLGPEHLFTRIAEMHEASLSPADEAEPRFAALAETLDAMQPASGRYLASALCELARLRLELGRNGEAREPASRCLALREESLGEESWETLEAAALLALASGHDTGIIATWRDVAGTKRRAGHPRVRWWDGRSP
ncbi:MAG: tetratricopeptide repeat protein [Wenzhouxiangellaceae bacterium]|nr:tetratricopeptide repeat protein [Wenzhouxiangellaceae bacterium]